MIDAKTDRVLIVWPRFIAVKFSQKPIFCLHRFTAKASSDRTTEVYTEVEMFMHGYFRLRCGSRFVHSVDVSK